MQTFLGIRKSTILTSSLLSFSLFSIACLPACGTDSSEGIIDAGKNLNREPALQGNWVSTCDSAAPINASAKATYKFAPLRYEKSTLLYKNADCTEALATANYLGKFKVGTSTDLKEGVNRIDLTPEKLTISASTQAGVDIFNLVKLCGTTDWAVGQARDVTQGAAAGNCLSERINQTQYDVYKLEDKKLTFGSTFVLGAPVKAENRPKNIGSKVFTPAT